VGLWGLLVVRGPVSKDVARKKKGRGVLVPGGEGGGGKKAKQVAGGGHEGNGGEVVPGARGRPRSSSGKGGKRKGEIKGGKGCHEGRPHVQSSTEISF